MSPLVKGKSKRFQKQYNRNPKGNLNLVPFPKGKSGYPFTEREVICKFCGKKFITTATIHYYCSQACKEQCRPDTQKTSFICEFCGKTFKRRAPNNAGRFCSRRCSGLWITANGKKSYFYKAFLYLPHRCAICNNNEFEVLVVHHKDGNKHHCEIGNLQILCANCHYKIHFGNGGTRHKKIQPILDYLREGGGCDVALSQG